MSKIQKISARIVERVALALIAVLGALVLFTAVAHAQATSAPIAAPVPVESTAPAMGPAVPVGNIVEVPRDATADCFNIYRNGVLIGDCVKPLTDEYGDYYFDDSSDAVTPASKWTYEVSAVNATGESPRVNQGGPYQDWSQRK